MTACLVIMAPCYLAKGVVQQNRFAAKDLRQTLLKTSCLMTTIGETGAALLDLSVVAKRAGHSQYKVGTTKPMIGSALIDQGPNKINRVSTRSTRSQRDQDLPYKIKVCYKVGTTQADERQKPMVRSALQDQQVQLLTNHAEIFNV